MTRRVTFLAVAVIVAAIAFGLAWPRIDHDRIESINSPVSVHGWDEAGLLLADGRHLQLPEFVRLPIQSAALSEATKRGVEFGADGRIYGLVRVHHWCGNDPVREHIAKVDLSHMLTFIREGERTTPPSDPDVLARESDGWFSEWGWDVGKFYQYQMYSKHFIGEDCITAVRKRFAEIDSVTAEKTDITKLRRDAWATAGNSFGDMGGGVDRAIDCFFSGLAQEAVQDAIRRDFFSELPVGSAVVVRPLPKGPILIYAPTMRVPGNVGTSINAYLAMRAILISATKEGIGSLACPTLGTGVGGLAPDDAADQMFQAYRLIVMGEFTSVAYSLQAPYVMR